MPELTATGSPSNALVALGKRVQRLQLRIARIKMRLDRPGETKKTLALLATELVTREAELAFREPQLKSLRPRG